MWNEISCTKLQLPPEPLTRGLLPPDPRSLCPQMNLLNPPTEQNPWVRHWLGGKGRWTCALKALPISKGYPPWRMSPRMTLDRYCSRMQYACLYIDSVAAAAWQVASTYGNVCLRDSTYAGVSISRFAVWLLTEQYYVLQLVPVRRQPWYPT